MKLKSAILALLTCLMLWGGLALCYIADTPREVYWIEQPNLVRT